jgi:hypothetical protein
LLKNFKIFLKPLKHLKNTTYKELK